MIGRKLAARARLLALGGSTLRQIGASLYRDRVDARERSKRSLFSVFAGGI
jgi:hypothetical protein